MRHTQPAPSPTPVANGNGQQLPNGNGRFNDGQPTASSPYQANGQQHANGEQNGKSRFNALLEEAQALHDILRNALNRTNQLIGGLKQYRRQAKTMASTLTALRQLEPVEA